jgi:hypothetical protein
MQGFYRGDDSIFAILVSEETNGLLEGVLHGLCLLRTLPLPKIKPTNQIQTKPTNQIQTKPNQIKPTNQIKPNP